MVPATATLPRKLRFFVLDDEVAIVDAAFRYLIQDNPQQDLELVDTASTFNDGVIERIRQLKIDVVVVDIAFGPGHPPLGLQYIRKIRLAFGPTIGIIAYSGYCNEYGARALELGADCYRPKETPTEKMREAIRTCKEHETLTQLRLSLPDSDRRVVLEAHGTYHGDWTQSFQLPRNEIALLCYLAMERRAGESGWLASARANDIGKRYQFTDQTSRSLAWTYWKVSLEKLGDSGIARCAHEINKKAKQHLHLREAQLVVVPGVGLKRDMIGPDEKKEIMSSYSLNLFLDSKRIAFNPERD